MKVVCIFISSKNFWYQNGFQYVSFYEIQIYLNNLWNFHCSGSSHRKFMKFHFGSGVWSLYYKHKYKSTSGELEEDM